MSSQPTFDVFLSYASADRAKAVEIAQGLEKQGLSVWFDTQLIDPGGNVRSSVLSALRGAKAFVILVSNASEGSASVAGELANALATNNALGSPQIIPLKIAENSEEFPFLLQFQYFDARTPESMTLALGKIARVVSEKIDLGPLSPVGQQAIYEPNTPTGVEGILELAESEQMQMLKLYKQELKISLKIRHEIGLSLVVSLVISVIAATFVLSGKPWVNISVVSAIGGAVIAIFTNIVTRQIVDRISNDKKSESVVHE